MEKIKTKEMELSLAIYFHYERNLIIPNISWGAGIDHECDLLVITPAGFSSEVEIKVTASDLKADKKKRHQHHSEKLKFLYFAIPHYLLKHYGHIPAHAGILVRKENGVISEARKPALLGKYKFSEHDIWQMARACNLRLWSKKGLQFGMNKHILENRRSH